MTTFPPPDPSLSFAAPEKIAEAQDDRLRQHVHYCLETSPYYKEVLSLADRDIESLSLKTISTLPLTTKDDLSTHNDAFFAVPSEHVVDIVLSSGTTGTPTQIIYTRSDLERLAYNEAMSLAACGITKRDTALLTCTLDRCFIAGLAYFKGLQQIGAASIRNGQNSLESHARMMERLTPSVVVGVPSFLKKLGSFLIEQGTSDSIQRVTKLVCIGEPLRDHSLQPLKLASDLEALWSAPLFSTYASSETTTSFCECQAGQGGHLLPDLAVVEIVDEQGQALPAGKTGEVVVTPLGIEGMPLIRFRTGDISFIDPDPCDCGRQTLRLGPILGRRAQMLKIRGTTLYPQAIFSSLSKLEGVEEYYLVAASENTLSDRVTVHAAVNDDSLSREQIQSQLQADLRVKPDIVLESAHSIRHRVFDPSSRKPIRFFDQR